jgi:hypothetical protein
MRASNPVQRCSAGRGRSGGPPLTWDPHSPSMTARARPGPALPDAVRTQRGPGRQVHRELGKHPPVVRRGLLMQLGRRRRRPWLSVNDRWLPMLRARRAHGQRGRHCSKPAGDGHSSAGRRGPSRVTTCLVGKRPKGAQQSVSAVLSARGLRRGSSCSTYGILGSPSRRPGSAWSHACACQPIRSRPRRQGQGRAVVAAQERRPIPLTARRPATPRRRSPRPALNL